ncbi:MAG: extracellular solute-binding protein [Oscillospiraceae bacterium]|nr:extracellular solute-binding protein [Oscillospiraceae bacterium]
MKKRRLLLMFLIICISILPLLYSCGNNNSSNNSNTDAASQNPDNTSDTSAQAATEPPVTPDVTSGDYNGYKFRFLTRGSSWNEWKTADIYAENENGDTINDAVYKRNSILEDKFNITISENGVTDPAGDARKSIKSGDDAYDSVVGSMNDLIKLSQEGLVLDLNQIPHMNLSNPWWDQKAVNELTLGGKLFCATGDLFIADKDATWVMMFNKKLIQDFQLEDPYSLVRSGQWTMDKFDSIIKNVAVDVNGDGKMDQNDLYGFSTHEYSSWGFLYGAGIKIAEKDSTGYPALVMNTPITGTVMEKTVQIMKNGLYTYCVPVGDWAKVLDVFQNDRAVFYGEVLQCAIRLRQMETNFGLIPYPKYDASQTEYPCMVNAAGEVMSVPTTCSDTDRTGTVLENMSYLSRIYLKPAYYDVALKGKFMRDDESSEMLDLIMQQRVFDLGYIFDWGTLGSAYDAAVLKGNSDFTSLYDKYEAKAQDAISKLVQTYQSLS